MTIKSLYHDTVIAFQLAKNADNESINGAGVDMKGLRGVAFLMAALQGEAADWTIKAQQAAEDDYSDAADLAGTSVTVSTGASTDAVGILEIINPGERYVRPVVTVPDLTAATAVAVVSVAYGGRYVPETAPTYGEIHISPAEGTA